MFKTKKDDNENEMRTLIELLYGSVAIKEQALSSQIFLWADTCSDQQETTWSAGESQTVHRLMLGGTDITLSLTW